MTLAAISHCGGFLAALGFGGGVETWESPPSLNRGRWASFNDISSNATWTSHPNLDHMCWNCRLWLIIGIKRHIPGRMSEIIVAHGCCRFPPKSYPRRVCARLQEFHQILSRWARLGKSSYDVVFTIWGRDMRLFSEKDIAKLNRTLLQTAFNSLGQVPT